jgi:hypothetical protein
VPRVPAAARAGVACVGAETIRCDRHLRPRPGRHAVHAVSRVRTGREGTRNIALPATLSPLRASRAGQGEEERKRNVVLPATRRFPRGQHDVRGMGCVRRSRIRVRPYGAASRILRAPPSKTGRPPPPPPSNMGRTGAPASRGARIGGARTHRSRPSSGSHVSPMGHSSSVAHSCRSSAPLPASGAGVQEL